MLAKFKVRRRSWFMVADFNIVLSSQAHPGIPCLLLSQGTFNGFVSEKRQSFLCTINKEFQRYFEGAGLKNKNKIAFTVLPYAV